MHKVIRSSATWIAVVLGFLGVLLVLFAWRLPPFSSNVETTENAYVRGKVTFISPQLAGYVAEVPVQDYQHVKAGDLLLRVDDRIYSQKLAQAQATLTAQKAALAASQQKQLADEAKIASAKAQVASVEAANRAVESNFERVDHLLARGVTTQKDADQSRAARDQAQASVRQAQAALEVANQERAATLVSRHSLEAAVSGAQAALHLAEIDLSNTRIVAPVDGQLGEVGVKLGQYVVAGTQLMSVVPPSRWIVANFKETQLAAMELGRPVSFTVDALNGRQFTGRIERFSPATGSEFSVLKVDNTTGNFTKIAQRLPVRISIDPDQELTDRLLPGMSVVVRVDTGDAD